MKETPQNQNAFRFRKIEETGLGLSLALSLVVASTTLAVNKNFFDPFNRPKLLLLSFSVIVLSGFVFSRYNLRSLKKSKILVTLIVVKILAIVSVTANSNQDLFQSIQGIRGRQLGALTITTFFLVFLLAVKLSNSNLSNIAILVLVILGIVQVLYGTIQFLGKDPIAWNNPYNPIIQTFGNPNFASAFNGIFAGTLVWLGFVMRHKVLVALSSNLLAALSLFLILKSDSIQGFLSFATIIAMMIFCLSARRSRVTGLASFLAINLFVVLAALGTLNRGPLGDLIYQSSISARGDYWRAAFQMFLSHPLIGVGLDSFGDFFGEFRDINQVKSRGYMTYSDNAHNVLFQSLATGGLVLLLSDILLILVALFYGIRNLVKSRYAVNDPNNIIFSLYLGTLAINMISIENMGFNSWSYLFAGIVVGNAVFTEKIKRLNLKPHFPIRSYIVGLICLICLITFSTKVLVPISGGDRALRNYSGALMSMQLPNSEFSVISDRIMESAPSDVSLITQLASYASQRQFANTVIDLSERGLKLDSRNINLLRFKAIAHEDLGQYREANNIRRFVRSVDPYRVDNLGLLARNFLILGQKDQAEKIYNEMKSIAPFEDITKEIGKLIMVKSENN